MLVILYPDHETKTKHYILMLSAFIVDEGKKNTAEEVRQQSDSSESHEAHSSDEFVELNIKQEAEWIFISENFYEDKGDSKPK